MDLVVSAVRIAADRAQASSDALRAAARQAVLSGATITDVAAAARVTRQTIYRWTSTSDTQFLPGRE